MYCAIIVGTRPEIIKMSPIIKNLQSDNRDYYILHTGQHYSYNMNRIFFEQLGIPKPKYNLDVGSGKQGWQTGSMMEKIEEVFCKDPPEVVLVQGDTNSVLAGSLVSRKMGLTLGHVEAGLRSFDKSMPEEINRIVADHCSDFLFAPTNLSKNHLLNENILSDNIYVTGNTIVDAIETNKIFIDKSRILYKLNLDPKNYFLATLHRQENVDNKNRLLSILNGLNKIIELYEMPIVLPVHPRTKKMMHKYGLDGGSIRFINPLDYWNFLKLLDSSMLIYTDSGGVQEEACILGVPCITLRDNTERQETLKIGANRLVGAKIHDIVSGTRESLETEQKWSNPYGDGNSANEIFKILFDK